MKPVSDILERVFTAADNLFEHSGRAAFPTVDAVRKAARVNMNDANSGMREWRRMQISRAAPVPIAVPSTIMQAQAALASELWQAAQTCAAESLVVAQAAWDAERQQLETINKEMADAFELQLAELDATRGELNSCSERASSAVTSCELMRKELEALRARLTVAEGEAKRSEVRAEEVTRRADELRRELDYAHQELVEAHAGSRDARRVHADELMALRADARQAESMLQAELEASRQQQTTLLQLVAGVAKGKSETDSVRSE